MNLKTRMILTIGAVLTVILVVTFLFVVNTQKTQSETLYYNQAKSINDTLKLVRTVITNHGGIFAKQTEDFGVNPYLKQVVGEKAEMKNAKGDKLALINGFSFVQEMAQAAKEKGGTGFSFRAPRENPFNPVNKPTKEELEILTKLRGGEITEYATKTTDKDGKKIYVYNGGMPTQDMCVNCHPNFTVGKIDTMMSVALPIEEAEARSEANMLNLGYIFAAALAIIIGLTYWIASRITSPIKHLADIADRVSKGDMDVTIDVNRKDEIGELAESFNRLIASIKILTMTSDEK